MGAYTQEINNKEKHGVNMKKDDSVVAGVIINADADNEDAICIVDSWRAEKQTRNLAVYLIQALRLN